ncbi:Integrase, catalytic region [Rhodopseudomonas palustris BisB5]|uniref:Integrase, catalytic region n=1 Tax=Rhodopseudomonas palustris (strain BisB5) TaxID=316057 RepID=Q132V7_RHOPS|nr:Integrase, catalytic region [Rhodopseudomonas palustris BisB5]
MTDTTFAPAPSALSGSTTAFDLTPTDVKTGERYAVFIPDFDTPVVLEFRKELSNGSLRFARYGTDLEIHYLKAEWDVMRSNGRACRISDLGRRGKDPGEIEDIDPSALLDPDEQTITVKERAKRLLAAKRLEEARTLRFYVLRYDDAPAGKGHVGVANFIGENWTEARDKGFKWIPSSGALLRAVNECGAPGERPLSAFLNRRGLHNRSLRWPKFTTDLAIVMNSEFWSKRAKRKTDVISDFYAEFDRENAGREEKEKLTRPTKETLRLWICAGENYWSWRSKYGEKAARRRFKGHHRPIEATCPLEYVMIDHTRIDAWAAIYDEKGTKVLVERPWLTLAIDVYSRMILGAVLTYESPSVYSALLCLKQVVRRKSFLIDEFGYHKGATDGWGRPTTVIADNGWEFVGISFQVCCEAAGIHVIWAPVKAPEFKPYVERVFGILNEMLWHRLDQGIPLKPQEMTAMGLTPHTKAVHTLEWLYHRMWTGIVTLYHVEEHGADKIVPAKRWREGLLSDGRPTIDDVRDLDKALGRSQVCLLTTSGITFDNHRFHDPDTTSMLLDRLLRKAKRGTQRNGRLSSGVVAVLCTYSSQDCSSINVWDFVLRKNVSLPNWNRRFSEGLSFKTAADIRNFARVENRAFHSDADKHAARAAFGRLIGEKIKTLPFGQARKLAGEIVAPQLVAGDFVEQKLIGSSATDDHSLDVPQTVAAGERTDDRIPDKGFRRGGKAATRKATATRRANIAAGKKEAAKLEAAPPSPRVAKTAVGKGMTDTEAAELLASLSEDLD